MFCSISLFSTFFFHHDFLSKPLQFTANLYFRTLSLQRGAHFNKNLIIYIWSGTIFSRRPTLGRVSFERCANFTFSIFVFIFSKKWDWRQLHTLGLWTPSPEGVGSGFALKKQYFLHTFNENHQKPIGFSTILGVWWITCGLTSLWGPRAPSLRPLLGSVGCPSGLGSFLGSFLVAFGVSGMYLGTFFGLL